MTRVKLNARERQQLERSERVLIRLMNRLLAEPEARLDVPAVLSFGGLAATIDTVVEACPNANF